MPSTRDDKNMLSLPRNADFHRGYRKHLSRMTNQDSINYNECFYTVSELNYEYVAIMDPDEVWLVFVSSKKTNWENACCCR